MTKKLILTAAAFLSVFASVPALAQDAGEACIMRNRIDRTEVFDNQTLVITDRQDNAYTVHMLGTCGGLTPATQGLTFRPNTEYGCLKHGDSVGYWLPGQQPQPLVRPQPEPEVCVIDRVTAGAPESTDS